ncbi:MAG: hypothetical protein ABJC89_04425 [Acidobacteriota bacterium]
MKSAFETFTASKNFNDPVTTSTRGGEVAPGPAEENGLGSVRPTRRRTRGVLPLFDRAGKVFSDEAHSS